MSQLRTDINRNFRIKINGRNYVGPSISEMVGFEGLARILASDELTNTICRQALESPNDIFVRKLRRGLTIRFYTK